MKKQILCAFALTVIAGASFGQEDAKAKRLAKFDTNKDGKLDLKEFTVMIKTEFEKKGKTGHEQEAAKRFKNRDANKDSFLSLEEFKATKKSASKKQEQTQ